tara:strand:- start:3282 stop:3578 length:297 start_codon:yes stop_codon:yes gene_type:complete
MKKVGRPKIDRKKDDRIFISMKISESLAKELSKDASIHFRNRSQHIQWILKTYMVKRTFNSKSEYQVKKMQNSNTSIYTDKEMDEMHKYYNKENEGDS